MSSIKRAISRVKSISSRSPSLSHSPSPTPHHPPNGHPTDDLSFTDQKIHRRRARQSRVDHETDDRREHHRQLREQDPLRDNYGDLPLNMSQQRTHLDLSPLHSVASIPEGERVSFRARVHHIRPLGSKIVFIIFRNQLTTLQGVLTEVPDRVSQNMVRWAEGLNRESFVLVRGIVQKPQDGQHEVHSTRVHNHEVKIEQLYVESAPTTTLPFQVEDVSRPLALNDKQDTRFHHVGDKTRLDNRVLDLRSPVSHAIFRIHSAICTLFRCFLLERRFIEIQSTKLQESSTEAGAAVFKVDYFRHPAFLAQSPQLAKQMCIAADMERVFEIGPVFRAENSNTHRHLTEFTGLDIEMSFDSHYSEVLDMLDDMFKYIFRGLQDKYRDEIETVKLQYPHDDLVILDETPRLKFADGIRMLRESGWTEEDGSEPSEMDDLSTRAEQRLGQLVKDEYGADYYILDKFPLDVRPFYTMPDPEDNRWSNSFDIFLRGEEILSGGQRIHHAPMLEERMEAAGIDPATMEDYLDGFRWGCPPHGGGGTGLDRLVMLFLKLGNIRWASLFPRDPKSFSRHGQDLQEATMSAAMSVILHGPESTTRQPRAGAAGELPPLENLIAKYGDATNTSWIDPAWTVWRDAATGAAVGYIAHGRHAVAFGNPLCEVPQIAGVVKGFLAHVRGAGLVPVWCCVSEETERHLARGLGWSALIAVAEERLNPVEVDPASNDKSARRKIHRAEREGVRVVEVEGAMEHGVRVALEARCAQWSAGRRGTQVHLTGVRPFDDMPHRKYFYALDRNQEICCLVVLAQLAPAHGFQIKWALEFPGAPLGAIEYIVAHVIKKLGDAGVHSATFGAGAAPRLQRVENIGGLRVRTLEKAYNGLSTTFSLGNKGDFRSKFGIQQDPLYICYPKGGLGVKGIEAIMAVLQKPK